MLILWFAAGFFTSVASASARFSASNDFLDPATASVFARRPLTLIEDDLLARIGKRPQLPGVDLSLIHI